MLTKGLQQGIGSGIHLSTRILRSPIRLPRVVIMLNCIIMGEDSSNSGSLTTANSDDDSLILVNLFVNTTFHISGEMVKFELLYYFDNLKKHSLRL